MEKEQVLLTEYETAQDSAQHHDGLVWSVSNITWAAMLVLLGFVISNIALARLRVLITVCCLLGLLLVVFQWQVQLLCRSVKVQKYERCKQIEAQLGMTQHTNVTYAGGRVTALYRTVSIVFVVAWVVVFVTVWS